MKPRVVVLTCIWKRYEVLEIFVTAVKRMQRDSSKICEIEVVAVGSNEPNAKLLCEQQGIHYLDSENKPLGRKWNKGLEFCQSLSPDFVLIMGSDDILSSNVIPLYLKYAGEGFDYIGLLDIFFYNALDNEMIYWPGYTNQRRGESLGLGRFIGKKILDRYDWRLWDDELNMALDNSMTKRLRSGKFREKIFSAKRAGVMSLDIKGAQNISKFSHFKGVKVDTHLSLEKMLPVEEVNWILSLPEFYREKSS
jgi:hypothetical protein